MLKPAPVQYVPQNCVRSHLESMLLPVNTLSIQREERLYRKTKLSDFTTTPTPTTITTFATGHPTECIVDFFHQLRLKRRDPRVSAAFVQNLVLVLLVSHPGLAAHCGLAFDVWDCAELAGCWPERSEWLPPCRRKGRCSSRGCAALANRFGLLLTAADIARACSSSSEIVNALYAHIDAHMRLLCVLHHKTRKSTVCDDAVYAAALQEAPVDIRGALTAETMPDISPLIVIALKNYGKGAKLLNNLIIDKLKNVAGGDDISLLTLLFIVNKYIAPTFFTCSRQHHTIVLDACKSSPELFDFVCKMVTASVLGLYPGAPHKAHLELRKRYYLLLHQPNARLQQLIDPADEDVCLLLTYMCKEYMVETVHTLLPGMRAVLETVAEWTASVSYQRQIMDRAREVLHSSLQQQQWAETPSNGQLLCEAAHQILLLHSEYVAQKIEPTFDYDINIVMTKLWNLNYTRYHVTTAAEIDFNKVVTNIEPWLPNPNPTVSPTLEMAMSEFIECLPRDAHVPIEWLVLLGLDSAKLHRVRCALFERPADFVNSMQLHPSAYGSRRNNSGSNPAPDGLTLDEYAILYTFFALVHRRGLTVERASDVLMYFHNINSALFMYNVKEDESIPVTTGTILVCDNCGDIKNQSNYSPRVRNKNRRGIGKVMLDIDCNVLCARRINKTNWRLEIMNESRPPAAHKNDASDDEPELGCSDDDNNNNIGNDAALRIDFFNADTKLKTYRKMAKTIATYKIVHDCKSTILRKLCVLGRPVVYNNITYICCFKCVRVIQLSSALTIDYRLMCKDCHEELHETDVEKTHRCEYCLQPVNPESNRALLLFDDCPDNDQVTVVDNTLIENAVKCAYTQKNVFKTVYFCTSHGTLEWVNTYNVVRLTTVIFGLSKGWDTINKYTGRHTYVGEFLQREENMC